MTEELTNQLIAAGLSKQQANSQTAQILTEFYMKEDEKILIAEAKRQVSEMKKMVFELKKERALILNDLKEISLSIAALSEAQEKYGEINDERARNAAALYGAILSMNEKAGSTGDISVKNAGYVLYAFLGGQAKREIQYHDAE